MIKKIRLIAALPIGFSFSLCRGLIFGVKRSFDNSSIISDTFADLTETWRLFLKFWGQT
jgi:hypothetical protein